MTLLPLGNKKVVVLSNRSAGPGRAVSGLVSAVEPILEETGGTWVACGFNPGPNGSPPRFDDRGYVLREVSLSPEEYQEYYLGLANACLWPVSHCFVEGLRFSARQWETYRDVNVRFAHTATRWEGEGSFFWVHDYHLALVPALLRKAYPTARVAFFWHIPFPPYDVFRIFPWRGELMSGMLGANLVGFHTTRYVNNFLECVEDSLDAKVDVHSGQVFYHDRPVQVKAMPVGIDWQRFTALAVSSAVRAQAATIRRSFGARWLLLGVDRLDYTKGILERLEALDLLLEENPNLQGKVTLLQVGIPSRENIAAYRSLRSAVEAAVGRLNGKYDRHYQSIPVRYVCHPLGQEELVAHYLAADVALVTPLRDGLNLVAKEFVACRDDESGVLVLSTLAGVAEEMPGSLLVNPYDTAGLAGAIRKALEMSPAEQRRRMRSLRQTVQKHELGRWWHHTLKYAGVNLVHPLATEAQTAVND
ncbi:MAG: trehalose-6-phosphate synthase [Peptococcaceae bacterium]|jgi:trehalose 6-phosphate synthase|nr:trehalose-6-phosphate synthase [Peptococcaceae bacterium]